MFCIGSSVNFYKNDAGSVKDIGFSINATLYDLATLLGIGASIGFIPVMQSHLGGGNHVALVLLMTSCVIFIVAPLYDLYRARRLRKDVHISYFSFVIEFIVATMYIGGSVLFFIACIFFFPGFYHAFAVDLLCWAHAASLGKTYHLRWLMYGGIIIALRIKNGMTENTKRLSSVAKKRNKIRCTILLTPFTANMINCRCIHKVWVYLNPVNPLSPQ